ncbi:hypothetical protein AOQ84DRAFT_228228 [Glonium stellatum]|uniref:Uncharacterized protein n=1 Tax=Glonium stellatum TaxID=574774 RepID=A0A8E2F801_9PEZI|nr:hypothetical protein AOQ84DRAFT_228228 [Glonium stellatum]
MWVLRMAGRSGRLKDAAKRTEGPAKATRRRLLFRRRLRCRLQRLPLHGEPNLIYCARSAPSSPLGPAIRWSLRFADCTDWWLSCPAALFSALSALTGLLASLASAALAVLAVLVGLAALAAHCMMPLGLLCSMRSGAGCASPSLCLSPRRAWLRGLLLAALAGRTARTLALALQPGGQQKSLFDLDRCNFRRSGRWIITPSAVDWRRGSGVQRTPASFAHRSSSSVLHLLGARGKRCNPRC